MKRNVITAIAALLGVFVWSSAAAAAPTAFGSAQRDSLAVTSGVEIGATTALMRGGWGNENISCDQWRRLTVEVEINYSTLAGTDARFIRRSRTAVLKNCASRLPNFGFRIRAGDHGFACADGRWRPGVYSFATRSRQHASDLRAIVTLNWTNRARC